jgi:tetratricopeptide (TPR) repeat protein
MLLPHKVYVVDTNALLNDPDVLYSFSGGEVVVPAVVLKELDNLKRRRTDRRVRYHGRKATRILFEISQNGRLLDGVTLSNGSVLRVDPTEEFIDAPGDLDLKRIDDQILALAYTINRKPGVHTTLVTNDLNMLLRGEAMGLDAYRFEGKLDQLKEQRRTPMEWFREKGIALVLGILAVVLAVSTIYLYTTRSNGAQSASLPVNDNPIAMQALGVSPQVLEKHYHELLAKEPNDAKTLTNLADLLSYEERYLEAVDYYRKALGQQPKNANVRTNMGISLLRLDRYQEAIEAFRQAAVDAPNDAVIHYNLGVALAVPRAGDPQTAISELTKAIALAEQGNGNIPTAESQNLIEQLRSRIEAQKGPASGATSGGT